MSRAEEVIKYIDEAKLTKGDLYKVHRHLGNMIRRRMFYQLIVMVPWERGGIHFDHTDRFEELLEKLSEVTVECINQEVCDIKRLPRDIFVLNRDGTSVVDIREDMRDEQDFRNIWGIYLGAPDYKFVIDQHEVSFDYVDPHYK